MNGLEGPSSAELVKRMEKRLNQAHVPKYDKRFNRNGVTIPVSNDEDVSIKGANMLDSDQHGNLIQNGTSNR